ncbi:hypothetical protein AMJ39_05125 [candidate division TA06 bacterium DG_24]|uniref:Uncharacterized protein n=3 Tax=Bacteria division TA06 TaxID=1156500 RepID=A0A0S8JS02_UNCT6|nr:MAG: hypothetical protein AMJ39_05125 [candidate division TA06 bacterium DG_24]KPK71495.1 MAG: hypothetical protein AMJ82_00600 [candidate division TA06 bacterium SM23_40]KPL11612.1 MAG: hypothetical protein AMJ71_00080 [candidate division TA06 bacterium SM1_40]
MRSAPGLQTVRVSTKRGWTRQMRVWKKDARAVLSVLTALLLLAQPVVGFEFSDPRDDSWTEVDKIAHFVLFASASAIGYGLERTMTPETRYSDGEIAALIAAETLACALAIELVQGMFARDGDGFSWKDMTVNVVAIGAGLALAKPLAKYNPDFLGGAPFERELRGQDHDP